MSLNFEHIFDDRKFNDDDVFIDERDQIDDVLTLYLTEGDRLTSLEHYRGDGDVVTTRHHVS